MKRLIPILLLSAISASSALPGDTGKYAGPLAMDPPHLSTDKTVKYDYDIVYVRAPRNDRDRSRWAEVGDPRTMESGADLMLLHPDGTEEVLVAVKDRESIADPFVSFDGQSVYYAKFHDAKNHKGSDIYKVHVPTRKIVQLTQPALHAQYRGGRLVEDAAAVVGCATTLARAPSRAARSPSSATAMPSRRPTPAMLRTLSPCNSSSWTTPRTNNRRGRRMSNALAI